MKSKVIYFILLLTIFSCDSLFDDFNENGYRDGQNIGTLINDGSIIGYWEQTHLWNSKGEHQAIWEPVNVKHSDNYEFFENGTFTSTNNITDCQGSNGTYEVEESKIILTYNCEPNITKEVFIDEFFFTEKHIVFIQNNDDDDDTIISKLELIK